MKNTKAKSAIEWMVSTKPIGCLGFIVGKRVFIITQGYDLYMYINTSISMFVGEYSCAKSAKRGAERFAKRMREIFA